jgi:peptide chain release factor 3
MKRKQFAKGMEEIAEEGAIQIFFEPGAGMERVVVGVVGVLQFEVLEYRMKSEYGVDMRRSSMPHSEIRYVKSAPCEISRLRLTSDTKWVKDVRERDLLIFTGEWSIRYALENNEGLELSEFAKR